MHNYAAGVCNKTMETIYGILKIGKYRHNNLFIHLIAEGQSTETDYLKVAAAVFLCDVGIPCLEVALSNWSAIASMGTFTSCK